MSKTREKEKAIQLRKCGESIKDIAKLLGVSKGSVSTWCEDITLTIQQKDRLYKKQIAAGHSGRLKGALVNKEKRLKEIKVSNEAGRKVIGSLSDRDLLMLGIGLYWGEGAKSKGSPTSLVNSDVEIIKIGKKWMERNLGVKSSEFRPYLYINELHEERGEELLEFWSGSLNIPKSKFNKPIIIKHKNKKKYEDSSKYHGVLALRVAKSTKLKYQILGLIKACTDD